MKLENHPEVQEAEPRRSIFAAEIISLSVIIGMLYFRSLNFDFLQWDDDAYITLNPYIRSFNPENIQAIFSHFSRSNYAPLHILSYSLDYALWGLNSYGFHLANTLLHLLNTVLLYLLLLRFRISHWIALTTGIIFAIHPVQIETVVWLSQRKSLLAFLFFMLSFHFYLAAGKGEDRHKCYLVLSVLAFLFSGLSKISAITAPILYLLYDRLLGRGCSKKNLLEKVPFFLIALALGIVALISQRSVTRVDYYGGTLFTNVLTVCVALVQYIRILFLPVHLSALYYFEYRHITEPAVLISLLVLSGITLFAVMIYRKNPELRFWILWPIVTIIPNLQIVPLLAVMADRYLYIPMVGLAVLITGLWAKGSRNVGHRMAMRTSALIILVLLGLLNDHQTRIWQDNTTFWTATAKRSPSPISLAHYGSVLLDRGDLEEAGIAFTKSADLNPDYPVSLMNLGILEARKGNKAGARYYFKKASEKDPSWGMPFAFLGRLALEEKDFSEAVVQYEKTLKLEPQNAEYAQMLSYAQRMEQTQRRR